MQSAVARSHKIGGFSQLVRRAGRVCGTTSVLLSMGGLQERGALVFEPRRFVELRKKPFWKQFLSSESTGMGIFYTLNVFCIQACLRPPVTLACVGSIPGSH